MIARFRRNWHRGDEGSTWMVCLWQAIMVLMIILIPIDMCMGILAFSNGDILRGILNFFFVVWFAYVLFR